MARSWPCWRQSPAPLKDMATREASGGPAQAKLQGWAVGAGRFLTCSLPGVGGAVPSRWGEEPRMEEAWYPGVQLRSCWLLRINRCLEEFAAASPCLGGGLSAATHRAWRTDWCGVHSGRATRSPVSVPTFLEF